MQTLHSDEHAGLPVQPGLSSELPQHGLLASRLPSAALHAQLPLMQPCASVQLELLLDELDPALPLPPSLLSLLLQAKAKTLATRLAAKMKRFMWKIPCAER